MEPEEFAKVLESAWQLVRGIEPARGKALADEVLAVRTTLEQMTARRGELPAPGAEAAAELDGTMASIYARAAAVAIAAGDEANAERWLAAAEGLSRDDDQRAELAAARRSHERYRALVHGRNLIANDREADARAAWKALTRGEADAIARAAAAELKAPRPLRPHDSAPSLGRYNGFGTGFYGRRDAWPDHSYVTTHCVSALWIPVLPLRAWRVRDADGGYQVLAREQLSSFARVMRWLVPAAVVLAIAGYSTAAYLGDPARLARLRFDDALEAAQRGDPEAALHRLDGELANDLSSVDAATAERAGAEIVRLTAGYVTAPFTADKLDQALRVVHRYQALPPRAQPGAARDAVLGTLERWTQALGTGLAGAEPRLTLLGAAAAIADADHKPQLVSQITATRVALAAAKQADWPLDALAILVDPAAGTPDTTAIAAADPIVARLCDAPSLLIDAGSDLDAWLAATTATEARTRVAGLREAAIADRAGAEAEGVTAKQLAAMQQQRPSDQFVALQLARNEASAGDLDRAAARLTRLAAPGMMIRQARFLLAQITAAQGKLDAADAQLGALLGPRLARFAAASAAVEDAGKIVQERIRVALEIGDIPLDLRRKYDAASETERHDLISGWVHDQMATDQALSTARAKYDALGDVVPVALAAGSVKLRRAQALAGTAREAMLKDAERTFLAIRTEAEGQPSFRLALGEIYARLGKTAESDAELAAVLGKKDPELSLRVAGVYRDIGSVARAKQVASEVFTTGEPAIKQSAALMLAVMSNQDDAAAEGWYRKADQRDAQVRASLLEIEAKQLARAGKDAECAAKFAAAARTHLTAANARQTTGYNNAAIAHERGFACSGDPQALRDAVAALEIAFRDQPEDPIVAENLATVLLGIGQLRVVARHIDARALRLNSSEVDEVLEALLDSPERPALLAELTADPSLRRADDLIAQVEVLAPNNPMPYALAFRAAARRRDVAAVTAVMERVHHAKALDVSESAAGRERWLGGADDDKYLAALDNTRARLERVLAHPGALDPRTRAAGWYVLANNLSNLGVHKPDIAALARARDAATRAMQLWPALDANGVIVGALLDEAGLDGDARTWGTARRQRGSASALDQLVMSHAPLAAKVRAARQWLEVAPYAKADTTRPGLGDVRLARLLGDPALEARAGKAFDDPLVRLGLELNVAIDPTDAVARQDLAYFTAH